VPLFTDLLVIAFICNNHDVCLYTEEYIIELCWQFGQSNVSIESFPLGIPDGSKSIHFIIAWKLPQAFQIKGRRCSTGLKNPAGSKGTFRNLIVIKEPYGLLSAVNDLKTTLRFQIEPLWNERRFNARIVKMVFWATDWFKNSHIIFQIDLFIEQLLPARSYWIIVHMMVELEYCGNLVGCVLELWHPYCTRPTATRCSLTQRVSVHPGIDFEKYSDIHLL
jgi:hypothetical protein